MRDLKQRLREIVKDTGSRFPETGKRLPVSAPELASGDLPQRELTVELEDTGSRFSNSEKRLPVSLHCSFAPDDWHGRRRVGSYAVSATAPIGLFDATLGRLPEWARRIVFFDLETTGLSGGAGTLPFLAGCGWFDDETFHVRQFFLNGPGAESAMLDGLADVLRDASLLVTFNGRSFDVPLLETRFAFHRKPVATSDVPHFDMLHPARRLWRRREDDSSCTLSALERAVLGFHRVSDVPGFEIPVRYFHYLRTGDWSAVEGVLEHNRHDIVSTAAVMGRALQLAADGPESCRDASEQLALGHLYERAGDTARAIRAYELAAEWGGSQVRRHALASLATRLRRDRRHDDAARAWAGVLELSDGFDGALTPLERRATEALAVHLEHRAHDLSAAREYAETLHGHTSGRSVTDAKHRLARIDRKIQSKPERGLLLE
jgi:uncharacterized protein YprB with RNaseH-like and TPR domain